MGRMGYICRDMRRFAVPFTAVLCLGNAPATLAAAA
jgi:hypothetical protein